MTPAVLRAPFAALLATVALLTSWAASAQTTTPASTMVRVRTTAGLIDIKLTDTLTPVTVSNFLAYVRNGDYADVFFHRSMKDFVVQTGGFKWQASATNCCTTVTSRGTITNEFSADRPNVRGTVAMAKVGTDANSATSQWFVSTVDNTTTLGSTNAGGFAAFGSVTAPSMAVVDAIAGLPILDAGGNNASSNYRTLPVLNWTGPQPTLGRSNLVMIIGAVELPPLSAQTDNDRVFNFLEAVYQASLGVSQPDTGDALGYSYRYYAASKAYLGIKDGKVWYQVPSVSSEIRELGNVADILVTAKAAGY